MMYTYGFLLFIILIAQVRDNAQSLLLVLFFTHLYSDWSWYCCLCFEGRLGDRDQGEHGARPPLLQEQHRVRHHLGPGPEEPPLLRSQQLYRLEGDVHDDHCRHRHIECHYCS